MNSQANNPIVGTRRLVLKDTMMLAGAWIIGIDAALSTLPKSMTMSASDSSGP